jgi:hypothetical protein
MPVGRAAACEDIFGDEAPAKVDCQFRTARNMIFFDYSPDYAFEPFVPALSNLL